MRIATSPVTAVALAAVPVLKMSGSATFNASTA